MINLSSYIMFTVAFFLLVVCDNRLIASHNENFCSLHADTKYLICSYLWDRDDQQASCAGLINFSMTCKHYYRLVDRYFLNIEQSYFNDNKDIIEHFLIVKKDCFTFSMNNSLVNIFMHKISLKVFINEIINLQNKISRMEAENSIIVSSLNEVKKTEPDTIIDRLKFQDDRKVKLENKISILENQINYAMEHTEKKIKDLMLLIGYGNQKLNNFKNSLDKIKTKISVLENALYHHKILMDNCLFQEALTYDNVSEYRKDSSFYWEHYKKVFYKKRNILEAFVIAKLLYQNPLYKEFAVSLIKKIQEGSDLSFVIERLLKKEIIISAINTLFEHNLIPLIDNAEMANNINLSSFQRSFTIMVLAHCCYTFCKTPLADRLGKKEWKYLQKRGPLFFDHERGLYIHLPPLIVHEQNNVVTINGDFVSGIIISDGDKTFTDKFGCFCRNFNVDISTSEIFRFSFLHHCTIDINNVCRKRLLKDKHMRIKIDNGITVLLPCDNEYVFSANQRFLHEVATNGYGNQALVRFEVPINKMKDYKNAILEYKHIFYWVYFLNKGIVERCNSWDVKDSLKIFLKIFLLFYSIQGCLNIIMKQQYYTTIRSMYNILRTVLFLQKAFMPREIKKCPTAIPWHVIDIIIHDSLFLHSFYKRDIDFVMGFYNIFHLLMVQKSVFWVPLLRKCYYYSIMDNSKIMVVT
jgi:hypothetical protein